MFTKQNGITLVALVITIVVLLILAGVTIASFTGENSILDKAENSVDQYNQKADNQILIVNSLEQKLENFMQKYNSQQSNT